MSKDIIVLAPNGRRQKVHCTPDTSILQVLEDVCLKQGYQASDYDLKHHNHVLDPTITIRFSNLPNKATLEMVEADRKRAETNVTVGLTLEDGSRRTGEFPAGTSLLAVAQALAAHELAALASPAALYMRREVAGLPALRTTTLRQLGLIGGRALIRLLDKPDEPKQANVSAVYRRPVSKPAEPSPSDPQTSDTNTSDGANKHTFDPVKYIKDEKCTPAQCDATDTSVEVQEAAVEVSKPEEPRPSEVRSTPSSETSLSQDNLERRLRIEEEVIFLGAHKTVAFMQPETSEREEVEDLPDEFYELSVEEVRRLYHELQQQRRRLDELPLLTAHQRLLAQPQGAGACAARYRSAVVRVQFPERLVLQAVFSPSDALQQVYALVREHLREPDAPFLLVTSPLRESVDASTTLAEARMVPCVHFHFRWRDERRPDPDQPCLRDRVYQNLTAADAAAILASKYRAPTRQNVEDTSNSGPTASTSKNSKVPKWFKN